MKKIIFDVNQVFLFFVALVTGILFFIGGSGMFSALLSGLFVYVYLRFLKFIYRLVLRLIGLSIK